MAQHLAPISAKTEQRENDAQHNLIARMGTGTHKAIPFYARPVSATRHVSWLDAISPDVDEVHEIVL